MSAAGWSRASAWCTARERWPSPPTRGFRAARWAAQAAPRSSAAYAEALSRGVPIVGLWHSGGARLAEGVASLHAVGTVFAAMTRASGRVPQISVVLGPAAGGAAYGPALTDIVILSGQGRIFVTGPDVVRSVTGEDVDMERLGGPEPHSRRSGVVHVVTETDADALDRARPARGHAQRPGQDHRRRGGS